VVTLGKKGIALNKVNKAAKPIAKAIGTLNDYGAINPMRSTGMPTPGTAASRDLEIARDAYERYGSSADTSFEEAYNAQTIIGYSDGTVSPERLSAIAQERATAREMFELHGTSDGSDNFQEAYLSQSIYGYGTPLPSMAGNLSGGNLGGFGTVLDAINGDGTFGGVQTGNLLNGGFDLGAAATGVANVAVADTVNSVLSSFSLLGGGSTTGSSITPISFTRDLTGTAATGLVSRYVNANGDYSGATYRIGNNGMGNGFSLALSPGDVAANRANFASNIGGGLAGAGLLLDAVNGDGTFMGQQTGNLFQGNLNLSGFNAANGQNGGVATPGTATSTGVSTYSASTAPSVSSIPVARPSTGYVIPNTGPR
jgi:hypothetical protein